MRWLHLGGTDDPPPEHTGGKGMDRGRRIGIVVSLVLYRMRVRGIDRMPASGPLVVVANHRERSARPEQVYKLLLGAVQILKLVDDDVVVGRALVGHGILA